MADKYSNNKNGNQIKRKLFNTQATFMHNNVW